jgi:hypothetical protein
MAVSRHNSTTTRLVVHNGDGGLRGDFSVSYNTAVTQTPEKVSGEFVVLPGGTRFRKATDYSRFKFRLSPDGPQKSEGYDPIWGGTLNSVSSDGGYAAGGSFVEYMGNGLFSSPLGSWNVNYYPQVPQSMRNEAVTKALLKIADQKVNLGENLATLGQTIRLLAGVTGTLAKSLQAAYRDKSLRPYLTRSIADLRRDGVSKVIAGKYLEYVYGWKPLMQDVYNLYELAGTGFGKTLTLHAQASSRQQAQNGVVSYHNISDYSYTNQMLVTEKTRVTCHLWARLDPEWQGARAFNQLGLLNPVSLAWELVPWSFVVDWILPIGSVLAALSAPAGLIFIDGSLAARISANGRYEHNTTWPYYYYDWPLGNVNATGSNTYEGYVRQHLTSWPLPGFWVDQDPLRGDRIFKALALLIANLGGMRTSTLG